MNKPTIKEAFLKKVKFDEENWCWEWIGPKLDSGYGLFIFNYKTKYAHRLSYEIFKSEIPKGLEINHICRNRKCVNPEHLEAVTHSQNMKHAKWGNKKENTCKNGHIKSKENQTTESKQRGYYACKICAELNGKIRRFEAKQRLEKSKFSATSSINIKEFVEKCEYMFGKGSFKVAVKLKLFAEGINTYSSPVVQGLKYLNMCLLNNQIGWKDIIDYYDLKETRTRLDKQKEDVLLSGK